MCMFGAAEDEDAEREGSAGVNVPPRACSASPPSTVALSAPTSAALGSCSCSRTPSNLWRFSSSGYQPCHFACDSRMPSPRPVVDASQP